MEKIPVANKVEKVIDLEQSIKDRASKTFFNYSGIVISAFLMFVVVLVVTTDIQLELKNIASLGMDFFLLLFCSYASYILCADSGEKAGMISTAYINAKAEFDKWLDKITSLNIHCVLGEFCAYYIKEDLRTARMNHLVVAGVTYDEYEEIYSKMNDKEIDALTGRSEVQKKALKAANRVQPIKLLPDQIIGCIDGAKNREPLGIKPTARRNRVFALKFTTISIISIGMVLIGLNSLETSGWLIFVSICFKLGSVLYNCFDGYKTGYEGKSVHSTEYMYKQVALMRQALVYSEQRENEKGKHHCADEAREGTDH